VTVTSEAADSLMFPATRLPSRKAKAFQRDRGRGASKLDRPCLQEFCWLWVGLVFVAGSLLPLGGYIRARDEIAQIRSQAPVRAKDRHRRVARPARHREERSDAAIQPATGRPLKNAG
jgi:hypothetical protein